VGKDKSGRLRNLALFQTEPRRGDTSVFVVTSRRLKTGYSAGSLRTFLSPPRGSGVLRIAFRALPDPAMIVRAFGPETPNRHAVESIVVAVCLPCRMILSLSKGACRRVANCPRGNRRCLSGLSLLRRQGRQAKTLTLQQ